MSKAIKQLRNMEWSMGNGQCPQCHGCRPNKGWWTKTVGHQKNCGIALALKELGANVQFEKINKSKKTRPSPVERKIYKSFRDAIWEASLPIIIAETNREMLKP
jgi:hypothetical protein